MGATSQYKEKFEDYEGFVEIVQAERAAAERAALSERELEIIQSLGDGNR